MQEYAVPNMQKICTMYTNEICNICLYASIYKNMQTTKMHLHANIHMHICAKNIQKYAKLNMHKYAFLKYV